MALAYRGVINKKTIGHGSTRNNTEIIVLKHFSSV